MAKKKKKSKEGAEGPEAVMAVGANSVLEQAWKAYQAGDVVTAREGAAQLLAGTPSERDKNFAAELAPELFGKKDAPAEVPAVAGELLARTNPPPRAYWFAALAAFVFAVLLLIAKRG